MSRSTVNIGWEPGGRLVHFVEKAPRRHQTFQPVLSRQWQASNTKKTYDGQHTDRIDMNDLWIVRMDRDIVWIASDLQRQLMSFDPPTGRLQTHDIRSSDLLLLTLKVEQSLGCHITRSEWALCNQLLCNHVSKLPEFSDSGADHVNVIIILLHCSDSQSYTSILSDPNKVWMSVDMPYPDYRMVSKLRAAQRLCYMHGRVWTQSPSVSCKRLHELAF